MQGRYLRRLANAAMRGVCNCNQETTVKVMAGSERQETESALDRLDAVLARLEKAVVRPNAAESELRILRQAHEAMRAKVGHALADLDGLLEEFGEHR